MPQTQWPANRRVIGTKVPRLDGPAKATGTAKYSYDINRPGQLHAKMLRCPYAHAKIESIDTAAAEKMPGFKAIYRVGNPQTKEYYYAGDEILAIAADTEEHALDAIRAIKVSYQILDHFVTEDACLKAKGQPKTVAGMEMSNIVPKGEDYVKDKDGKEAAQILADPNVVVSEGTYGVPTISHQCLESHGLCAEWDKDGNLTVWCSTQAVPGTAAGLAPAFGIPATKVKCITHYMGGGFGSKFGADVQGNVAAQLAKLAGAPVKLMLDRADEITAAGSRPSAYATVKLAGNKQGQVLACDIDSYGSPGIGNAATVNLGNLPYIYAIPAIHRKHAAVRLNIGASRAMRAPGHPQNCFITEAAIDDLAAKLGIDPLQIRMKHLPAAREAIYKAELEIATKLIDYEKKWHPPGKGPGTVVKHGIGMGLHTWGGADALPNPTKVTISADGSVLVQSGTQDLGTAERTVLAIVVAEVLGLEPKDITVQIGDSSLGNSTGSGGSTTTPGTAPAALNGACDARDLLFDKIATKLGAKKEDLVIQPGKVADKANNKSFAWKEACAKLGMESATATGDWTAGLSSQGVGGVQIAEVMVDTETGVVRCTKIVAVQDCGLIINKLGCESQTAGGVIMGLNYALLEESIYDNVTGRMCNPDMEFYKLGGIQDMPEIIVHMHDMPERGVIGIGEPPTISTAAAIGNAVHNAIGVRVPNAPFTPDRVLAALAKKGGGA